MELNTIEQINHELDILDAKQGILNLYYQDAANQRLHFEELCESLRGVMNQNRNDYNSLEQRKKELCEEQSKGSHLSRPNPSPFQSVGAVVEDYVQAIQSNTSAEVARTLND